MLELDLVLEPEEAAFQARVRRFLAEKFTPELRREAELQTGVFAHGDLAAKWHRILYEAGWIAPGWPEEYGGAGFTATQKYIFDQECARAGTPDLPVAGIRLCGPVLIEFGTPDQKDRFLPRILSGEHVWCQGYSEPQAGSDLAALECRAVRDGDHYIVSGQKVWTTHAQFADWIFVLVRTSREGPRQAGISFLLVPMDAPGMTVRPIISMSGEHEMNEVFFDAVRVPVENLVGEENQGWKVAKFLLVNERGSGSAAAYLRNALGMLDKIVEPDGPFGANASDPAFARQRAQIEIEIAALEQSEHSQLEAMRQGGSGADDSLASIHKLHVSSLMQAITELEVDAIGEYAQIYQGEVLFGGSEPSSHVPRRAATPVAHYLNMRAISIFGGSSEIQRNILTRTALGLTTASITMDDEQSELLASVENLVERVLVDKHEGLCGREFSREAWHLLGGELGLLAVGLPDELGGMGGSHHAHAIVLEAFGRHLVSQPYLSSVVAASQLLDAAKPEHTLLLSSAGRGEAIIVPALSDGPGDQDMSGRALIAAVGGDGFVLNGVKALVRDAALADQFVVLARTQELGGGEHVLLLVPARAAGLAREDFSLIDQATASHLRFENVHVGSSALIASGTEALRRACSAVNSAVVGVCAEAVGVMKAMHAQTVEFARQRVQFGRPIAEFQVLQHRMVDMLVAIEQAESITRLARNKLGGADATLAASASMALVAKVCRSVAQDAVQIHGAIGIANETPISRYFRRGLAIEKQFGGRNYHLMRYSQETAQRRTLAAPASA